MFWQTLLSRRSFRSVLRGVLRYLFGKRGQRRVWGLRLFYRMRVEVLINTTEPVGKLTRRMEVRLWVDGQAYYDRVETCLRQARSSVIIQMFLWKDDAVGRRIAQAVVEAADRGVRIEIAKEAVGDFFEGGADFLSTKGARDGLWKRFWNHDRITVHYAANDDHAKVFCFDDQILLLSGMNIGDEYLQWHDYTVELRGTRFVRQYLTRDASDTNHYVALVMNTEERKAIRPVFMSLLSCAQQSIVFEHSYLADEDVVNTLIRASNRHVRVIVIIPGRANWYHHANMQSVGRLLTEGNPLFMQVLVHPTMVHAKTMLVDRRIAFLGSANSIRSSLDEIGEVNVLIEGRHREAIRTLRESLREDIIRSRSVQTPPAVGWFTKWLAALGL